MPQTVPTPRNRPESDTWLVLDEHPLSPGDVYDWALDPKCGAVVMFSGTVRDHAEGRSDVQALTYEAYESQVIPRMEAIVGQARDKWKYIVKVALHHRTGHLKLSESSVLVVVSSPHRPQAFEAARFIIDALKATVPIWKKEHWSQGDDWGTNAHTLSNVNEIDSMARQS